MFIKKITNEDSLWESVAKYADHCSWRAGKFLARQMRANEFTGWERILVVIDDNNIAGYCTLARTDCIPEVPYSPYIGYMFVDEQYRGHRLSEKLINYALQYAKELNFEKVYIVSDHVNFYEKYGFEKIDERTVPWDLDSVESIFVHMV